MDFTTEKPDSKYPLLWNLFSGHFHQDCDQEWQQVIRLYLELESHTNPVETAIEMRRLLAEFQTDEGLEAMVDSLGSSYSPRPDLADGQTYRQWISEMAEVLEYAGHR